MKKQIVPTILIALILFQFVPIKDFIPLTANNLNPTNNLDPTISQTPPFVPPDDAEIDFWKNPYIHFSIQYKSDEVLMVVHIKNNLSDPITLFNLWIQVNKSHSDELMLIPNTKIIEVQNKITLSTFDIDDIHDPDGYGQMIFHIKLYEGEVIDVDEEFNIKLNWYDPDQILAQYETGHISRIDDIQVFIQSSNKIEEFQPFPLIERRYYQINFEEGYKTYNLDFKVTNLMVSDLNEFNFTYIKMKDSVLETYEDFIIESPFLTASEISDISKEYSENNEMIEYKLKFGDSVILRSNEWLTIKTNWIGLTRESRIEDDFVIWNMGKQDSFNAGVPFYLTGLPFYPILSPAEPILLNDYDLDGLPNKFEKVHGFDPMLQETWLSWRSLRNDYSLNKIYANDLDLEGKIRISIPERLSQGNLIMKVESLGSNDILKDVSVDDQIIYSEITTPEDYIITYNEGKRTVLIKFVLSHQGTAEDSQFKINFLINGQEIPDLSPYFEPDSDSDGLYDYFEEQISNFVPDSDNDGIFDGIDFSPNNALNYPSNGYFRLNFPIKDLNGDSEIAVNLQIKPTVNDFTGTEPYRGNDLLIIPGVRIYNDIDGDYLPDSAFSTDDGATGIAYLLPMKHQISNEYYSWSGTFNYKHDNLAKNTRVISLKFSLVWLLIEQDPISGETDLFHLYENPDPFTVQGISITESEPNTVMLGLEEDGKNYRNTIQNAELLTHLTYSNLNYDPSDISNLQIRSSIIEDIEDLNETRDILRDQLLNLNNLDYEDTNFIYITSSFSTTYNLETLYNVFTDQNPLRPYTPLEIDNYYLLPQNAFTGILTTQVLKGSRVEFIDQFAFGYKIESVTKSYDLQFSKSKYAGSSCDEIFTFSGYMESNKTIIHYYDSGSSAEIESFNTEGWYQKYGGLKVIRIQLTGPDIPDIETDIGIFNFAFDGLGDFLDFFVVDYLSGFLDAIEVITVFTKIFEEGAMLGKFGTFMSSTPMSAIGNVLGVLNFIFGGLQLMSGISLYMQGAYRTGLSEGIRGGLQIASGVLMLIPDPTGITKAVAIGLLVFQLFDWIADTFFNFDFWDWFLGTILGIPNVDPDYHVTSSFMGYDNIAKIKRQAGLRVGDKMTTSVSFENDGNTDITLGLKIKAGAGNYGSKSADTRGPGSSGTVSCSDSFENPSPITTLRVYSEVSWFYEGWCKWKVIWLPPFLIPVCVPDSRGGPESDTQYYVFDMPVLPTTIGSFVGLIKSNQWFPPTFLETEKASIVTEITPATPNPYLKYELTFRNWYFPRDFILSAPVDNLWNYDIIYNGVSKGESFSFSMGLLAKKEFEIVATPTSENRLNPGDHYFMMRVQQEDFSLNRKDIKLDYTITPIYDFQVVFDPLIPSPENLDYGPYLYHYINVTNIGNIFDNYHVEVLGLDSDLYMLYKPDLTTAATEMDSSMIVFQIPYYKIVSVGDNPYTIRVSSISDPSIVKDYNFILHIDEYHRMSFTVDKPILSMFDSDLFVYNFTLINFGNVEEHFTITYDEVPFATSSLETNDVTLNSGETELFNLTLTPFELGNATFNIRAFSDYLIEEIELTINVTDDDVMQPYFENFFVKDNHNWLNISFIAIDEFLGDDLGLSNISIYVDGALVYDYQPTPSETIFNFSLTNDWIWIEGLHDIRVVITDADNDRISDDSLTTSISGTFEVTLDEMYNYIVWLLDEMNNYIYDNSISALYGVVTQKIVKIQDILLEAYQLIEDGYLHTGLVRNKIAEAKLEIADTKTELMINKQSMSQEHFDNLKDIIQNIRNKILEIMGLSMGTPFSHAISLAEVEIYKVKDFVEYNIEPQDSENLANALTLAAEKLEDALFDISLDKDTESSITSAQHALDRARAELEALVDKGKILPALGDTLLSKILIIHMKIEDLKIMV